MNISSESHIFTINPNTRPGLLVVAVVCFSISLSISMGIFKPFLWNQSGYTNILLGFSIVLTAIPFLKAWTYKDEPDYLDIIYPLSIVFLASYPVRTIYVLNSNRDIQVLLYRMGEMGLSILQVMLMPCESRLKLFL